MTAVKIILCALMAGTFATSASAESISAAAARISNARDKKAQLEKYDVKIGENVRDIGSLTIDDFLKLKAVPDGLDAVSAQALNNGGGEFGEMTTKQALDVIAVMRKSGLNLPEDLEKNIKDNPEQANSLMNQAFEGIEPAKVETKEDIAKQRRAAIGEAEKTLGIEFKDVLKQQKDMMTSAASKKKRGRKSK